jgi:hypothetical protein
MIENAGTIRAFDEKAVGFDFEKLYGIDDATVDFHVSKSQISRDSNSIPVRLPFILNDRKKRRYKAADLYQLYGFRKQGEPDKKERSEPKEFASEPSKLAIELAVLREQLRSRDEALQAKNDALKKSDDEIRDLRQIRDKLLEQNNRLTLLLPAPSESVSDSKPVLIPEVPKRSFWQRWFP